MDLLKLLNGYKRGLLGLVILAFLANFSALLIPRYLGELIDQNNLSKLNIIFGLGLIAIVLSFGETVYGLVFSERFGRDLRVKTFTRFLGQDLEFVQNIGSSKLISIFLQDIDTIQENLISSIVYLIQAFILLIGSIMLMFSTSWVLALVALASLPIVIGLFGFIFSKIGKLFTLSIENINSLTTITNETVGGSFLIRTLKSQKWEERKFANQNWQSKLISLKIIRAFSILLPSISFITGLTVLIILSVSSYSLNNISKGVVTSFIGYYSLLVLPIFIIGFTSQGFAQAKSSYNRLKTVLEAPVKPIVKSIKLELGDIKVDNIGLKLGTKDIFKNISFEIKSHQNTAIIGPTASGKSQLLNCLLGLQNPTFGQVFVNEVLLDPKTITSYHGQIGIVFQDSLVFNGSLWDNVVLGRTVTPAMFDKAIKVACIEELVAYDQKKLIEERGSSLSGGQKQRLMLARALVTNPKILFLDDFTARVDLGTENMIRANLKEFYPDTQIIEVAQKISSVKNFDQIVLLMEGELIAIGTHNELLTNDVYLQILQSQLAYEI
jgi:ATP-binding cassette, subfamily B, bacterial